MLFNGDAREANQGIQNRFPCETWKDTKKKSGTVLSTGCEFFQKILEIGLEWSLETTEHGFFKEGFAGRLENDLGGLPNCDTPKNISGAVAASVLLVGSGD